MNEEKPFWQSMTLWGVVVIMASTAAKQLFGVDIGTEMQNELAAWLVDGATWAGSGLVLWGRLRAKTQVRMTIRSNPNIFMGLLFVPLLALGGCAGLSDFWPGARPTPETIERSAVMACICGVDAPLDLITLGNAGEGITRAAARLADDLAPLCQSTPVSDAVVNAAADKISELIGLGARVARPRSARDCAQIVAQGFGPASPENVALRRTQMQLHLADTLALFAAHAAQFDQGNPIDVPVAP